MTDQTKISKESVKKCQDFLAGKEGKIINDILYRLKELCPKDEDMFFTVSFTVLCAALSQIIFCHLDENSHDPCIEGAMKHLKRNIECMRNQHKTGQ